MSTVLPIWTTDSFIPLRAGLIEGGGIDLRLDIIRGLDIAVVLEATVSAMDRASWD